ncbi:LOW QUALITY PROTEIN: bone morphogenetic protein receptor type-2-like [Trematomus bernacchii]|uniref:LOW QUALITY PROTEIN: bone morphogenetic protein receptor type-2-like n=1 Tax=Trematomus bernacchii TaxID=40690 RepID=UPI00146A9D6A|nr:LOW QUALITY PROTEIN: bone morphogenetic protein receptor type-2-like [Trematomus bernacchii]
MASVLAVCFLLLPAAIGLQVGVRECAFTEPPQAAEPHSTAANERGEVQENGTVRCIHGSRCYGVWKKRPDGEIHLEGQGCWPNAEDQQECHGDRCLVTATPSHIQTESYRFCCCNRDLCNTEFSEAPPPELPPDQRHTDQQLLRRGEAALIALATLAMAAVVIVALFLGYRMMKGKQKHILWAEDEMEAAHTAEDLKLLELIGRGRYGTVFRGSLNERCVAVKLFSSANRQSFTNERSIYGLPLLQLHDNIARFLAADERTNAEGRAEFLILMEYYPHGCLSSYLSHHTVDWSTCCRMTHGVTRGLAFLHTELHRAGESKPGVAHRDVSSRNVLLRSDLSCVLADFGLSMALTGSRPPRPGDPDTMAISEVGTVRYMAPEVLGGALDLRDCASALKQVDVYALGLLYWESFRRCSQLFTGEAVPEHQLAFQAELGNHPSFQEMQILVNRNKFRPRFPESWRSSSPALSSLMETMEDCWDPDAEARLTAQCAEERLCDLTLHSHRIGPPPVGPASSQDLGVVKNLHGDDFASSVVKTTTSGAEASGRNSITHTGGAVPRVCLQRTQEDLETSKLDPEQVDQNLNLSFDARVMEEHHPAELLNHQVLQSLALQGELGAAGSSSLHPLPKQQNLPQRPTSLHLQNPDPASCRLKLGRHRSNLRQVETGVAKMNTVTVATATEPHQVTTVTKTSVAHGYSAGVPVLVVNSVVLMEDEENRTNPLNPSPDEHAPLLRRDSDLHQASETRSNVNNNNNNNNRIQPQGLRPEPHLESQSSKPEPHLESQSSSKPEPHLESQSSKPETHLESQSSKPEPHLESQSSKPEPHLESQSSKPEPHLESQSSKPEPHLESQSSKPEPHLESQSSSKPEPHLESQSSKPEPHLESQSSKPEPHLESQSSKPEPHLESQSSKPEPHLESQSSKPEPHLESQSSKPEPHLESQSSKPEPHLESQSSKPEPHLESQSSKPEPHLESQSSKPEPHLDSELGPCVLRSLCIAPVLVPVCRDPDPGSAKPPGATSSSRARPSAAQNLDPAPGDPEPAAFGSLEDLESTEAPALEPAGLRERPWSLDLSSSGLLSDSSLKIKRRVKTPYTLKKWRPASWGAPSEATSSWGAPSEATSSWGVPSEATSSWGVPSEATSSWGVPSEATSSWGAPSEATSSWGAPSEATSSWGAPSEATSCWEFSRQRAGSVSRVRPSRATTSDPNSCF